MTNIDAAIQAMLDNKTKPLGALGQLEDLAAQICRVQQSLSPELKQPTILVFAADHGLSAEGVSAFPSEVTAQMVLNFVAGGAAINVFCQQHNIALQIIDAGVAQPFDADLPIIHCKAGQGTQSALRGAAMTTAQLTHCRTNARALVTQAKANGSNVMGFGEMGIGNTSSAALIMHYVTGRPLTECVGRGTGLDDAGWHRKLDVLERVVTQHGPMSDPESVLQSVGGFEIAMISYAMEAAYEQDMLVLVDGFIATAAALLCVKRQPASRAAMVFCHQSDESGHRHMLGYLDARPLLQLHLRLGEGTGCALAYPLLQAAVAFTRDMASFASAGVSNRDTSPTSEP